MEDTKTKENNSSFKHKNSRATPENPFLTAQAILEKVKNLEGEDGELLFKRVFEHSISDGLNLAESRRFTNEEYVNHIVEFNFYLKHKSALQQLISKASPLVKTVEDKINLNWLKERYREYDESLRDREGQNLLKEEPDPKTSKGREVLLEVDDWYSELLKSKTFEGIRDQDQRSKGERLGEGVMEKVKLALEERYYKGEVIDEIIRHLSMNNPERIKTIASKILNKDEFLGKKYEKGGAEAYMSAIKRGKESKSDITLLLVKDGLGIKDKNFAEIFNNNTFLSGFSVDEISKSYGLDSERVRNKTLYKPLDLTFNAEISLAEKELIKEINSMGGEILWNESTKKYEILNSKIEKNETKYLTEDKILNNLERLISEGADKEYIASHIVGLDSDRAWKMREKFISEGIYKSYIARGLAGLDSDRAWKMREQFIDEEVNKGSIFLSLTSLDSERAWKIRDKYIGSSEEGQIAVCLAGLDSERAWKMRDKLISNGVEKRLIVLGLSGLDSERAWKIREQLISEGVDKSYVVSSLAGLDSDRAWQMREQYISEGISIPSLSEGLAGLDSDRAWQMREKLISIPNGSHREYIAVSLVGLDSDRAWQMRERLISEGVDKSFIAMGLAGGKNTFIRQLKNKNVQNNTEFDKKIKLLNILNTLKPIDIKQNKIEEKEQNETKYLTEDEILDNLERLMKEGDNKFYVALGLTGLDSDRAWKMRERLISEGVDKDFISQGLAGLDSDRAWKMREQFMSDKFNKDFIAQGLAGLDSDRAWKMRERLISEGVDKDFIAQGLAGLDSDRAWQMREQYISEEVTKRYIALGLSGLDSDRAWQMREQFISEGVSKSFISLGLSGLDSDKAWEMREQFMYDNVNKNLIVQGLSGLDSDKAWKMREQFILEGVNNGNIFRSLAGLDSNRAWKMREKLISEGVDEGSIAQGLSGDYITFVWQLKNKKENSNIKSSVSKTIRKSSFDGEELRQDIYNYLNEFKSSKTKGLNKANISGLNSAIKEIPKEFLRTISAKKDNAILVERLMNKVFPSAFIKRERNNFSFGGSPSPDRYLNSNDDEGMLGGDPRAERGPNSEVMRFREPINGFIVSSIYGKSSGARWDSTYQFPVAKNAIEKSKEVTIVLPHVNEFKIKLPKPMNSNFLQERVKGIRSEKEFPLSLEMNPMGEGEIINPGKSDEIVYSLELDEIPKKMNNPSINDYSNFKNVFTRNYGKDMIEQIGDISEEVNLFLNQIKDRSPKEKVQLIEQFVRSISYYDMDNREVMEKKKDKDFEERIYVMEERVNELRSKNPDMDLSGKKYAGVCADFAVLTTSILRKAGFLSGVLSGFNVNNAKSVFTADAHATSFVVWPNRYNENEIFPVDGTPSGVEGISAPSLSEKEEIREKLVKEITEEARKNLDEINNILKSQNQESIEKLTNGELEKVLNLILDNEVKQDNLRAITRVFEAYWYTPISKVDIEELDGKIHFINFLSEEIQKVRNENINGEEINSGGKLFDVVKSFIEKLSKQKGKERSFETCRKIRDMVSNSLSEDERKAMTVIISYLEAKKVK